MSQIRIFIIFMIMAYGGSHSPVFAAARGEVVIYVSEDQVFSEPILKDFEKETGIRCSQKPF